MPRAPRSPAAKPTSWSWSGKSSSAGSPRSRTNGISSSVSALKTSPNTRKSRTPARRAAAWIRGSHRWKNAALTCRAVSIRIPSILYRSIQAA